MPLESDERPTTENGDRERLSRLRAILFGAERERLYHLEERLGDPTALAREVGDVLPAALEPRSPEDHRIANALAPLIEDGVKTSVRRDPQPLADAIFPVIGPAIRRAIRAALAELVQSINQTLDHTFSVRGLRWRWEAIRTGRSFGEVVLQHSLVYRVEQLYLIHRETGLLLQHVVATGESDVADMVAVILTAIQDFVRDSFKVDRAEALETMQVGELTVWIEQGPAAILAAVIRGQAPQTLRTELEDVVERLHADFGPELGEFEGNIAPFARCRPELERLLRAEVAPTARSSRWGAWAVAAAAIILLGLWLIPREVRSNRWEAYLDRLRESPGLVVTETGRRNGRYFVSGLRDPQAADPSALVREAGLDPRSVDGRWEPYVSLDPVLVAGRIRKLLDPPAQVDLALADGELTLSGRAPHEWITRAKAMAPALPGVTRLRMDQLVDQGPASLVETVNAVEQREYRFAVGSDAPGESLIPLTADLRELGRGGRPFGLRPLVEITGETDDLGDRQVNARLGQARADRIAALLREEGIPGEWLTSRGLEASESLASDSARAQHRRVWFRVGFVSQLPEER
jgi:OOP family OmpA-OmpF porin